MPHLQTDYQPLFDDPETPHEDVMFQAVSPNNRRWNHIEDLDSLFIRTYMYHQRNGYYCLLVEDIFELLKMIFVIVLATFLAYGIDYQMLFKERPGDLSKKINFQETFIPVSEWNMSSFVILCLVVAGAFLILRAIKTFRQHFQYLEIKAFYQTGLKIEDSELRNLKWHDVLTKLIETQKEQQMCIHKAELTELDIYHRILRFKNYMVAMINKSILPIKFNVPLIGEYYFFTEGLKFNLEFLFFWGPPALFQNNWHLNEEYKRQAARKELSVKLSKHILWLGIANAVLAIFIFPWQILYTLFTHCQALKYDSSKLSMQKWTAYGRLYLRHYNELDHELNTRLCRAYKPAKVYMSSFTSPLLAVFARNLQFMCGAILGVGTVITIVDEDFISIGHTLQIISVAYFVWTICRACIPDENVVRCHERLLTFVLSEIHYIPDHWKGNAHKTFVRDEFCKLFQYTFVNIVEELLSPIITPFFLIFVLRHKALDIVDFFRNFTVDVVGVGDVCSFAQLNVQNHGNPQWSTENKPDINQYEQGENGKTELSLMHFTLTNPNWKPPEESSAYIDTHRQQAHGLHLNPEGYNPFSTIQELSSISSLDNHLIYRNFQQPVMKQNIFPKPVEAKINTTEAHVCLPIEETPTEQEPSQQLQDIPRNALGVRNPSMFSSIGMYSSTQDIFPPISNMPSWNARSASSQAEAHNSYFTDEEAASRQMSESILHLHRIKQQNAQASLLWQHPRVSSSTAGPSTSEDKQCDETELLLLNVKNPDETS